VLTDRSSLFKLKKTSNIKNDNNINNNININNTDVDQYKDTSKPRKWSGLDFIVRKLREDPNAVHDQLREVRLPRDHRRPNFSRESDHSRSRSKLVGRLWIIACGAPEFSKQ